MRMCRPCLRHHSEIGDIGDRRKRLSSEPVGGQSLKVRERRQLRSCEPLSENRQIVFLVPSMNATEGKRILVDAP